MWDHRRICGWTNGRYAGHDWTAMNAGYKIRSLCRISVHVNCEAHTSCSVWPSYNDASNCRDQTAPVGRSVTDEWATMGCCWHGKLKDTDTLPKALLNITSLKITNCVGRKCRNVTAATETLGKNLTSGNVKFMLATKMSTWNRPDTVCYTTMVLPAYQN